MLLPNIHILGIQGSGKGTQSQLLIERYALSYISSGSLFRERATVNDELGQELKALLATGKLLSTTHLQPLVAAALAANPPKTGLLGDGVIRTLEQYTVFAPLWKKYNLSEPFLIHLALDDTTAYERIEHRRQADALAQGKHRIDDNPEAIAERIRSYHEYTEPVIALFREKGRCADIDSKPDITTVHTRVIAALEQAFPQLTSHGTD